MADLQPAQHQCRPAEQWRSGVSARSGRRPVGRNPGRRSGAARQDGQWQTYSKASTNGGLPEDHVWALALGADGTLWAGTLDGLARLDKNGEWRIYSTASTYGGLPHDSVLALALGADGTVWAGTEGGLARL